MYIGSHFMIFFDPDLESFFIRDLGVGYGLFINVKGKVYLGKK